MRRKMAGMKIANFVHQKLFKSSTPEIAYNVFDNHLVAPLTHVLVTAVREDLYDDNLGAVTNYKMPTTNQVRLVRKGKNKTRQFVVLTEDGALTHDRDFVTWVEMAYLNAIARDERVEQLIDEEINHILAEFQRPDVIKPILANKINRDFRLLTHRVVKKGAGKHVSPSAIAPYRKVAVGGKVKGIVGAPGDSWKFGDYPEVRRWFRDIVERSFHTRYDWQLNPRRRKRIAGQKRHRWIFRIPSGISGALTELIIQKILRPSADLVPSMNWSAIANDYIAIGAKIVQPMIDSFAKILHKQQQQQHQQLPVVLAMGDHTATGHAVVGILRTTSTASSAQQLELLVLDPHAEMTLGEEPLRILRKLEKAPTHIHIRPISIPNARMNRVQYAWEGSCGLSSISMMLAAARYVMQFRGRARAHKLERMNANKLAINIFNHVSDLDVVLASQLVHNVT